MAANSMISCSCPDISACLLIGDLRWIVYILVNWTCNGSLYNALALMVRFELYMHIYMFWSNLNYKFDFFLRKNIL